MRIATWNINGIRARHEYVALWLQDRQPDIVGLQELKADDGQFPQEFFAELGYHSLTHGQPQYNGVAVLTKESAELVQSGLPGRAENGARLLTIALNDLCFTTVYCPNGKNVEHSDYEMKLAWYEALNKFANRMKSEYPNCVLCGDFNICRTPQDSHLGEAGDGAIFHTRKEREALESLIGNDWLDVFRDQNPDSGEFSWWDYRAGAFPRNLGLRIDLLLITAGLLERIDNVVIDRDFRKKKGDLRASDHCPVYFDLN